jgi:glycosyltransferase involved in cell wall biosynthesis
LSQSEHEIHWLRLEGNTRTQESRPLPENIHEVDWREAATRTTWLDYLKLKDSFAGVIDKVKPDIVHAGPIQRVALLPALTGFHPLLSMSWGFDLLEDAYRDPIWRWATRYVLDRSDWFTSDCQTTRRKAEAFGFPEGRMTIFPWGVDQEIFQPKDRGFMRRQVGYEEDLLIVHTRSWEPRYGVDVMLQGFRLAIRQEPHLRMFMLGGGSQEKMVKQFVQDHGLEERILFCGYKENEILAQYYRAADVYLSASHIDGSSVALMEAMACACPALVSDIPANLEWVRDGQEGWVFKDGNAQDLSRRIVEIARNRDEVPRRGALALRKARQDANWQENSRKLLETYRKMTA